MPPRDPQPGEKYRYKRNKWEQWEYLQVVPLGFDLEYQPSSPCFGVQGVVAFPGVPPQWGRRPYWQMLPQGHQGQAQPPARRARRPDGRR
jgi:hypothetical protein